MSNVVEDRTALLAQLKSRQRRYVEGRLCGQTKLEAALAAGYSESTARNAAAVIERTVVRFALQVIIGASRPAGVVATPSAGDPGAQVGSSRTRHEEKKAIKQNQETIEERRERAGRYGYAASFDWLGNRTAWQVVRVPTRNEHPVAGPFETEEQALAKIEQILARDE